jgi:hypothetical protein
MSVARHNRNSGSLLVSLVLRISLVSIVSILILLQIVYMQIDRTLDAMRGQSVEDQARNIAARLEPSRGVNPVFLDMPNSLRQFYVSAGSAFQYIVRDEGGNCSYRRWLTSTAFHRI